MQGLIGVGYQVGDELPALTAPAVDRMRLAFMTVSMRDPNPVHIEDAYAAKAGLPSVIAHGTFVVSYLGAAVTRAVGVDALRRLHVDVTAPVFPGDVLHARAEVTEVQAGADGDLVTVRLTATRADGSKVGRGTATFTAP